MLTRKLIEKLNAMTRREFREKMRKAVLGEFFRRMLEAKRSCKMETQKQSDS